MACEITLMENKHRKMQMEVLVFMIMILLPNFFKVSISNKLFWHTSH